MIDYMKCVCGYESEREIFIEEKYVGFPRIDVLKGDDPFSHINHTSEPFDHRCEPELYACPKCGTLKIKLRQ